MPRLLCTGDLHLGAGGEYGRQPGDRLADQELVWRRILELAQERDVDGILFAGDAFEGPTPTSEHYDAFLRPLRNIWYDGEGALPFLAVSGNGKHDSAMRSTNALKVFDGLGITVSTTPDVYPFAGCAVATLPWVSPARLIAQRGRDVSREEVNAEVAQLLIEIAARGREDCERAAPGAPAILLGHWSVSGSSLPNGLPVDQLREPVLPASDLDALGFDHVVLGHIHKPQRVGERGFYVGSPMPLNFGEAGHFEDHGVAIIHTDETEDVDWYATEFQPIESRPFVTLDLTGDEVEQWSDAIHEDAPGELEIPSVVEAIVRVRYRATREQQRSIDVPEIRRSLIDAGAAVVKIVPEIVREQRARVEGLDEGVDELDALDQYIAANDVRVELAGRMRDTTRGYLEAAA